MKERQSQSAKFLNFFFMNPIAPLTTANKSHKRVSKGNNAVIMFSQYAKKRIC